MAINKQAPSMPSSPSVDLATELKETLTGIKSAYMNEGGSGVDYPALRASQAYADYREHYLTALRQFDPQTLPSVKAARSFWINLYNALVLDAVIDLEIKDSITDGFVGIFSFFRKAAYIVGGQRISLEDIEHGILRENAGNPYIPGAHFHSSDPRLAWILPLDPRIHFALNCGGRSCPPIRAYEAEKLDRQLELAARNFVDSTVELGQTNNEVILSKIFAWYSADFGKEEDIIQFIIDYLPDGKRRRLLESSPNNIRFSYSDYDWGLNLL